MCYTRRKIEGGVGALRESDDTNFLKPNGQSRNLNIYDAYRTFTIAQLTCGITLFSPFQALEDPDRSESSHSQQILAPRSLQRYV